MTADERATHIVNAQVAILKMTGALNDDALDAVRGLFLTIVTAALEAHARSAKTWLPQD